MDDELALSYTLYKTNMLHNMGYMLILAGQKWKCTPFFPSVYFEPHFVFCLFIPLHPGHFSGWPASTGFSKAGRFQFSRSRSIITRSCYPAGHPGDGWTEGSHPGSGQNT